MESISNGYNFRNMTGTYKAQFTVPAEVSESGKSFMIDSEGTAYIDKENSGIMFEGSGTVSYNNKAETERYAYLKYPKEAVRQGIQGRVQVDFVIDEKGRVTDVRAVRSSHPLLEEEALRVIKASPDWKPGRVGKTKVKSEISLNVEFRLEKKKK
jgi:TonB family protein